MTGSLWTDPDTTPPSSSPPPVSPAPATPPPGSRAGRWGNGKAIAAVAVAAEKKLVERMSAVLGRSLGRLRPASIRAPQAPKAPSGSVYRAGRRDSSGQQSAFQIEELLAGLVEVNFDASLGLACRLPRISFQQR